MNRKQLFILLGVLSALCVCAAGLGIVGVSYLGKNFSQAVNNADDPANVQRIAAKIADYTLPAGYKQVAFDLVIYQYIVITPDPKSDTSGTFMMMMSYPPNAGLTDEQMQEQMQRTFERQTGTQASMKVVDTRTIPIRGKDAKVSILEGKMNNGYLIRQWITVFGGKSGPVILMIQGYPGKWNDKLVNDFVASIK